MPRRITPQREGFSVSGTRGEPVSRRLSTHRVSPPGCRPSLPDANWIELGWTMRVLSLLITGTTSAPWRMSSRTSLTSSTAAMLPVMPRTIFFPFSFSLLVRDALTRVHGDEVQTGERSKDVDGWTAG